MSLTKVTKSIEGEQQNGIKYVETPSYQQISKNMSKSFYRWATVAFLLIEIFIAVVVPGDTYPFVRHSLGDLLVVILLYTFVKSFVNIDAKLTALGVLAFAFLIEFAQYFHIIDILGIKNQLIRIIVGTSFSLEDLLMYTLGAIIAFLVDMILSTRYAKKPV